MAPVRGGLSTSKNDAGRAGHGEPRSTGTPCNPCFQMKGTGGIRLLIHETMLPRSMNARGDSARQTDCYSRFGVAREQTLGDEGHR